MNKETKNIFAQVWLADAAYANFVGIDITDVTAVRRRLIETRSFGPTEADLFVAAWTVRDFLPDTTSGFSATVFESKTNPGQFTFAIRGTQGLLGGTDLFVADLSDIFLDGLALDQIVDMYNYWQRLTAPKGSSNYNVATLDSVLLPVGTVLDLPTGVHRVLSIKTSTTNGGLGIIPPNTTGIDTTKGHPSD